MACSIPSHRDCVVVWCSTKFLSYAGPPLQLLNSDPSGHGLRLTRCETQHLTTSQSPRRGWRDPIGPGSPPGLSPAIRDPPRVAAYGEPAGAALEEASH